MLPVGCRLPVRLEGLPMRLHQLAWVSMASLVSSVDIARGDIQGFGDFSGFTINQADQQAAPGVGNGWIRLTNRADGEVRSIFCNSRQSVAQFSASFTYRAVGEPGGFDYGTCFVIQNSSDRARALGENGYGYEGIERSVALSLELRYSNPQHTGSGLYTNGARIERGGSFTDPIDLFSGHEIDVTIEYRNRILQTHLRDRTTGAVFEAGYFIDIASTLGSQNAYIGFTAGTAVWGSSDQYISNFRYTVPAPGALSMLGVSALLSRRRR